MYGMLGLAMDPLTPRQKNCLDPIRRHQGRAGRAPSYRELARALGLASVGAVQDHLAALERKGWLRRRPLARGLELALPARGLPILGRIAAGAPIEALENYEGTVD